MVVAQLPQRPRQDPGDRDRHQREPAEPERRLRERAPAGVDGGQQDRRQRHPDEVLDDAPAEQRDLGRTIGRAPAADGDVDDHHR